MTIKGITNSQESTFERTNIPGLLQNKKTKVIINKNIGDYERILAARQKKVIEDQLKRDVANLKNEVFELRAIIKDLLRK